MTLRNCGWTLDSFATINSTLISRHSKTIFAKMKALFFLQAFVISQVAFWTKTNLTLSKRYFLCSNKHWYFQYYYQILTVFCAFWRKSYPRLISRILMTSWRYGYVTSKKGLQLPINKGYDQGLSIAKFQKKFINVTQLSLEWYKGYW